MLLAPLQYLPLLVSLDGAGKYRNSVYGR